MRIVFLSRWFPYPADNGSRLRVFNLLSQLARRHELYLVSFAEGPVAAEAKAALGRLCREVLTVPYAPFRPRGLGTLPALLSPTPRWAAATYSRELDQTLRRLSAERGPFDLVIASQIDMAPYARAVAAPRRILEELELSTLRDAAARGPGPAAAMRRRLTWWKHARYVARQLRRFDGFTVVSARELALARRLGPAGGPAAIVPNGVDLEACAGPWGEPEPGRLIYCGALSYGANLDAVSYFLAEIMPLVRAQLPDAELLVTGRSDVASAARLAGAPGLRLTGYLADVRPAVAASWASVVPLREGGGTRLKVLESLALGTPVVATSKGAEGLELRAGSEILIADSAAQFAAATLALLRDPELRARLGAAGRQAVRERYGWGAIGDGLLAFVEAAAGAPVQGSRLPGDW